MINTPTLPFTKAQAISKAEFYCAYQERSVYEVQNKLAGWNLSESDSKEIIAHLVEENFLNEERFAEAYTFGKFRSNGWGKLKIKQALKVKKISQELITKSLQKIDDGTYLEKLTHLIEKKVLLLAEKEPYKRRQQLLQYALTKGYEQDFIFDVLNRIK